ncbi:hypothetical protein [Kocuria nitroreducens]|uniref:hypothetical protein n=1 Tax=Kocuria nitroreducens TaxID=3058914 RepID=UPI0036DF0844
MDAVGSESYGVLIGPMIDHQQAVVRLLRVAHFRAAVIPLSLDHNAVPPEM